MIRVLHYIGGIGLGGSQTFVMELYRRFNREEIQFDFVIFSERDSENGYKNEIESLGGKIYLCPRYSAKNHVKFCRWWDNFFNEHPEYKIIHGHVYSCASVYLQIAKRHGLATVCHAHSTSNGGGFVSDIIKRVYEKRIKNIADYLFACSTEAGVFLYGKKVVQSYKNYYMVPNCIDIDKFKFSAEKRNKIRSQYCISKKAFVVGHVGSFREAKNHEFIVSVFKNIKKENGSAILILVGIGERMNLIKHLCELNNISDSVIFAGNQHDVDEYYCAFDCFLFPSLWEGLPVSVVEAQASGLPCLISDRITKDVYLTGLIETLSLKKPAEEWARILTRYTLCDRKGVEITENARLQRFDSQPVAAWLQDFYKQMTK